VKRVDIIAWWLFYLPLFTPLLITGPVFARRFIPITTSNALYKFYLFFCSYTKKYKVTGLSFNFLDFATKENLITSKSSFNITIGISSFCSQVNVGFDCIGELFVYFTLECNLVIYFIAKAVAKKREFLDFERMLLMSVFHFDKSGIPGFFSISDDT
jgi:hypothetical protein